MSATGGPATRPLPVLAAAVLVGGAIVAGATALAPTLGAVLGSFAPAWQETGFSLVLYGVLALVAVVGRRLGGVAGPDQGQSQARRAPFSAASVAVGLGIGVAGFAVATGYAALAGAVRAEPRAGAAGMLLLGTLVVIGQSAAEELFFRGWLQPVLARHWPPLVAVGVTALAFAALHVAGGARSPLTLVNLLLGGVLFGLLALRGGLAAAIAAHAGWNWAEAIGLGLDPNPGTGAFGAIANLDLYGAARWGGSAEGLNASLAMTIVLFALILPFVAAAARRERFSPVPARD